MRYDQSHLFIELFTFVKFEWHEKAGMSLDKYNLMQDFLYDEETTIDDLWALGDDYDPEYTPLLLAYKNKTINAYNKTIKNPFLFITTKKVLERKDGLVNGMKLIFKNGKYYHWETGSIVDIKKKEIKKLHASTVHSFQGSDILNALGIKIHLFIDCRGMSKEMLYTALTRTPNFKYTLLKHSLYKGNNSYGQIIYRPSHIVYACYNKHKIVYVGITNNLKRREEQHKKSSKWYKQNFKFKIINMYYSERTSRDKESQLIARHQPQFNIQKKVVKNKGLLIKNKKITPLKREDNVCVVGDYVVTKGLTKRIRRKWKRRGKEATIALVKELANQNISVSQAEPVNTQENVGE